MFGNLFELKNANFGVFLQQKLVIKGNKSCQKQCYMEVALINVKTKAVLRFYCNLIYKLKLIKQNVIFGSFFFHIKIDIQR